MDDPRLSVCITGASGLLGRALVTECLLENFGVLAHYHTNPGPAHPHCQWLQGDFSSISSTRKFLDCHKTKLMECQFLVNNYGPITERPVEELQGEDLQNDFYHNVVTAFEITSFLLHSPRLRGVVWIGFAGVDQAKPYRRILSYAMAKHSLILLNKSLALKFPRVAFHIVSPATLEGAAVKSGDGIEIPPRQVAQKIISCLKQ